VGLSSAVVSMHISDFAQPLDKVFRIFDGSLYYYRCFGLILFDMAYFHDVVGNYYYGSCFVEDWIGMIDFCMVVGCSDCALLVDMHVG
jgi:hypothetical protein